MQVDLVEPGPGEPMTTKTGLQHNERTAYTGFHAGPGGAGGGRVV